MNRRRISIRRKFLYFGLASGLLFTIFFDSVYQGISVPIYLASVAASGFIILGTRRRSIDRKNTWLLLPIAMGGLAFFIYDNPLQLLLNLALILLFGLLWAYFFNGGNPADQSLWSYLFILPHVLFGQLEKPIPALQAEVNVDAWRTSYRLYVVPAVRGIMIAVPLLAIFILLMFSADVFFVQLMSDLTQIEIEIDVMLWLRRMGITVLVGWLLAGWLMYASEPFLRRDTQVPEKMLRRVCRRIRWGPIETNTILLIVLLAFVGFVFIQVAFLFNVIIPQTVRGVPYAEYARRGFFQLISLIVLALSLILILRKITRFLTPRGSAFFRLLSTLLIGSTIILLASAYKRMTLYEQTYGFTQLRLFVLIFMIWLGFLLAWFVITLWTSPQRFALGTLIAAIGFVSTLNLINPEFIIVSRNFRRYGLSGELDVVYLATLSTDATPALTRHLNRMTITPVSNCQKWRPTKTPYEKPVCMAPPNLAYLEEHLYEQHLDLERQSQNRSWLTFHWGRSRARQVLQNYFSDSRRAAVAR